MYRELDASELRRILRLEGNLPDVLLLVGELDVARAVERFAGYLEDVEPSRGTPGRLARYGDLRIAIEGVYGAPMAGSFVHLWCGAGVPRVVQLGWFGSLQHGLSPGDVVVPRHAAREEGVSDWYLPKGILADASPELAEAITGHLRRGGIHVAEGAIFTTPAMLAESREVILDWSRHGWQGVDMETAATFAVARHFGAERAAALVLWDDLVGETNLYGRDGQAEVRQLLRERERLVLHHVLDAVAERRAGDLRGAVSFSGDETAPSDERWKAGS